MGRFFILNMVLKKTNSSDFLISEGVNRLSPGFICPSSYNFLNTISGTSLLDVLSANGSRSPQPKLFICEEASLLTPSKPMAEISHI